MPRVLVYMLLAIYLVCAAPVALAQDRQPDPALDARPVQPAGASAGGEELTTFEKIVSGVASALALALFAAIRDAWQERKAKKALAGAVVEGECPDTRAAAERLAGAAGVAKRVTKALEKQEGAQ